jgi:V/A-type H+-transporting ATPase subunit E
MFMKGLETGKDKVKKICDLLKKETLEPARHEADALIAEAKKLADQIIQQAREQAEKTINQAREEIEKQKTVFQASLSQACRQTLDMLKEKIEFKLFDPELNQLILKPLQSPSIIAKMIDAIVGGIEKDGIDSNIDLLVSAAVEPREINELLSSHVLNRLNGQSVKLSSIGGGIEVKILKDHITIDLSDTAIRELVANYIRKDFRALVFGS